MASVLVLDAGILIASTFKETLTEKATLAINTWRQAGITFAAPTLFIYEVVGVARKAVYTQRATPEGAEKTLEYLLTFPIDLQMDGALLRRGYELAALYNRPRAYDTQYLAVAERLNCEFWTTDEKLFNAVGAQLPWVKWLGGFTPSQ